MSRAEIGSTMLPLFLMKKAITYVPENVGDPRRFLPTSTSIFSVLDTFYLPSEQGELRMFELIRPDFRSWSGRTIWFREDGGSKVSRLPRE